MRAKQFLMRLAMSICLALGLGSAAFAEERQPYRLAVGDTLSFSVLFLPDISREVVVGVDGHVLLPLVGALDAEGKTVPELQSSIAQRLQEQAVRIPDPNVTDTGRTLLANEVIIDIARHRPVYVIGAVQAPGEIEFMPGMTVRQAIARAGGFGQPEELNDLQLLNLRSERIDTAREVSARILRLDRLRADFDRLLLADGENAASPATPDETAPLASSTDVKIISDAWLQTRDAQRAKQKEFSEARLSDILDQIAVLEERQAFEDEFVALSQEELTRSADLQDRGIARAEDVSNARSGLLLASARSLETAEELLRVRAEMLRTQEILEASVLDQRVSLLEAIEEEALQLARLEERLRVLDNNLMMMGEVMAEAPPEILLRRYAADQPDVPVDVTSGTRMLPGDVVEVLLVASQPQ
ncbi:MAG: polysaccharide biosynthesis/export family protein [Pseudomonadota bacterium]